MHWTWDADKAGQNQAKHGVSFEAAVLVFDDPMQMSRPDPHPDGDRWQTIGRVSHSTLFVVHTVIEDDDSGRIISARKATPNERRIYEESHS